LFLVLNRRLILVDWIEHSLVERAIPHFVVMGHGEVLLAEWDACGVQVRRNIVVLHLVIHVCVEWHD
jgi:hypothetical protein